MSDVKYSYPTIPWVPKGARSASRTLVQKYGGLGPTTLGMYSPEYIPPADPTKYGEVIPSTRFKDELTAKTYFPHEVGHAIWYEDATPEQRNLWTLIHNDMIKKQQQGVPISDFNWPFHLYKDDPSHSFEDVFHRYTTDPLYKARWPILVKFFENIGK